jgi:dipeptidyl aminopeptidase/acylaminoacyl peptidase
VQDKGGNENFHIYAVNPAGEVEVASGVPAARDLTPLEEVRARIYALPKSKPGEMIVGLNDRSPAYHDVYRVDIATGKRELLIENTQSIGAYIYDLEGNVRLATRQNQADGSTDLLRIEGEKLEPLYTCTAEESCFPVQFHKDGQRVYMISNKGSDADLTRLMLLDVKSGEAELIESDPEGQVDFGGAVFSDATDELIATAYTGDRVRIYAKTADVERDLKLLRAKFPEGDFGLQSMTRDMKHMLVAVSSDVDPGSMYHYDREAGTVNLLYRSRPDLPSEHLAPMKAVRYKARDGMAGWRSRPT